MNFVEMQWKLDELVKTLQYKSEIKKNKKLYSQIEYDVVLNDIVEHDFEEYSKKYNAEIIRLPNGKINIEETLKNAEIVCDDKILEVANYFSVSRRDLLNVGEPGKLTYGPDDRGWTRNG